MLCIGINLISIREHTDTFKKHNKSHVTSHTKQANHLFD